MKKKLLSFLSLMVIAIFAFAATKGLQKADDAETFKVGISEGIKNGTIEVDKVTAAAGEEVTITATPDAGYKLVSYSVITYTSNEAVEVNDGKFIMPADQVLVGATFAAPEDITISPEAGDISVALDEATTGAGKIAKNITINLAENGAYTITAPINATASVAINGAAGAKIDATNLTGNGFINYASVTGDKAMKDETTASAYTILENITIKDVEFTALPKSIINSAAGKVLFKNILVSNAVIKMTGNVNVFGLGGGYPENLKIEKSTIWSDGVHKSFFFKADGKPADIINGTSTTTWTVDRSTLYNIAIGKKANNSNGGIKGKPTTYMVLTNSLLYNFGSSTGSEVNGWLWGQNGGAQATYSNNAYLNTDGTVTGWTDASKVGSDQSGTSIAGVMTFTSVETPDFGGNIELPYGIEAPDVAPGDPRWNVTFSNAAQQFDILIAEGIENGTVKPDKATAAAGDEITVTVTPNEGFELGAILVRGVTSDVAVVVTDGKFIMPADAVTISATFTQTTGVQAVKAEELKNAIIYTIGGQRVNSIKRGMFIINGRKVVVE